MNINVLKKIKDRIDSIYCELDTLQTSMEDEVSLAAEDLSQFDYDEQAEDWEYASHLHDMAESAHQLMYTAYSSTEESLNYLDELLAELEEE